MKKSANDNKSMKKYPACKKLYLVKSDFIYSSEDLWIMNQEC